MVIGSYQMVDFKLEEIPPGLIAHREWTPDNGRNNALRINGLGAPRAFYTPMLLSLIHIFVLRSILHRLRSSGGGRAHPHSRQE